MERWRAHAANAVEMFTLDLRTLLEPRGFIRILQIVSRRLNGEWALNGFFTNETEALFSCDSTLVSHTESSVKCI